MIVLCFIALCYVYVREMASIISLEVEKGAKLVRPTFARLPSKFRPASEG